MTTSHWLASLGARPDAAGTHFRVWAPSAQAIAVVRETPGQPGGEHPLGRQDDGYFAGHVPGIRPGARYRYRVEHRGVFPDPASRFQPDGVHGPSEVIDAGAFAWTDAGWPGRRLEDLVIYELHVGTFSPEGTFAGARAKLPVLAELGVTAVEIMPVADFPGRRNWGYDGVDIFAPARCYGRPDNLRALVNEAHRLGLAVILDVVYNHLGPDGNYLSVYSPYYFSPKHHTPWGQALNFDGPHSAPVRQFFIANALHWLHEYHIDGLRLDATQAIFDDGPRHFLAELSATVRELVTGREVVLIAEDPRNLNTMVRPASAGGWGIDAVWADDFHHEVRRLLAGDHEGYYGDFAGTVTDLATTIRQGWFYCGQPSPHHGGEPRGTDPAGLPHERFVHCIQNHDQVGNRALGERLTRHIDLATFRAASVLLLTDPATPLLFMGQEWAATTPFLFFTDHHAKLGKQVTEGRRHEFRHFAAFTTPEARARIPDPQAEATFQASKLAWPERETVPHAGVWRLYQALLRLRREEPALCAGPARELVVTPIEPGAIVLARRGERGPGVLVVVRLKGAGVVDLPALAGSAWEEILTTEHPQYCPDPAPPEVDWATGPKITFARPGAVILRERK